MGIFWIGHPYAGPFLLVSYDDMVSDIREEGWDDYVLKLRRSSVDEKAVES